MRMDNEYERIMRQIHAGYQRVVRPFHEHKNRSPWYHHSHHSKSHEEQRAMFDQVVAFLQHDPILMDELIRYLKARLRHENQTIPLSTLRRGQGFHNAVTQEIYAQRLYKGKDPYPNSENDRETMIKV